MNIFQKIINFFFPRKAPEARVESVVEKDQAPDKRVAATETLRDEGKNNVQASSQTIERAPVQETSTRVSEKSPVEQLTADAKPAALPLQPIEQRSPTEAKAFVVPPSATLLRLQEPEIQEQIRRYLTDIGARPTGDQWNMILESSSSTRVVAGAGSGKSTTLILRLLVLHKVLGIPLSRMKVFSFTRASVHEFQAKLAQKLELWETKIEGKELSRAEKAQLQADAKTVVSTFHSVIARLRRAVMPEIGGDFFDLLGSQVADEENEAINPLLNTRLSDEQLKILVTAHEQAFLGDERYRQILASIVEEQARREWQKINDKTLRSESEVWYWNSLLSQEKTYHGYRGETFSPSKTYRDSTGGAHADPYRAAVADRLRALGLRFAPLVPFAIRPPQSGWPLGTLLASFVIGGVYLHVDRQIDHRRDRSMFYHQRDRKKFVALYCPTFDQHKLLTHRDFEMQDDRFVLTPDADMRLQQWVGLQDWAAKPTTAPAIRLMLPGDIQQRHVAELLYQEGSFVESVGLEVTDLTLERLVATDAMTTFVVELLKIYWRFLSEVLQQRQLVRFHDVLARLRQPEFLGKVAGRIQFLQNLFIDEFQDISPEIVDWLRKTLESHGPGGNVEVSVIGIGDDFQSIYGWRGSSPTFLMDYHRHFPTGRMGGVTMSENFRSRQCIIDAGEAVLENVNRKIDKHGVSPIFALEATLPYGVLTVRSLGWAVTEDGERSADGVSVRDQTIWAVFCEHVVKILKAMRDKLYFETLFRGRDRLEIFVLSRSNAGLEKVPNKMSLQQALIEALRAAGVQEFEDVSIQSLTFHRSKGLEADFVLLVEDALPPEAHPLRNFVYSQAGFEDTYTRSQEEEARRLAYVGVTRARYGVVWVANTDPSYQDFRLNEQGCFLQVESHVKSVLSDKN